MIRTKVDFYPKDWHALHYYALLVSSNMQCSWDLRNYLPFSKRFFLAEKARSVVTYDRIINNQSALDLERIK